MLALKDTTNNFLPVTMNFQIRRILILLSLLHGQNNFYRPNKQDHGNTNWCRIHTERGVSSDTRMNGENPNQLEYKSLLHAPNSYFEVNQALYVSHHHSQEPKRLCCVSKTFHCQIALADCLLKLLIHWSSPPSFFVLQ